MKNKKELKNKGREIYGVKNYESVYLLHLNTSFVH